MQKNGVLLERFMEMINVKSENEELDYDNNFDEDYVAGSIDFKSTIAKDL